LWRRRRRRGLTLLPLPFRTSGPRSWSNGFRNQRSFEATMRRHDTRQKRTWDNDTFEDGFSAFSWENSASSLDLRSTGFFETRLGELRRSDLLDLVLALIVRIVVPTFVLVAAMKADNILSRNRG
jgi:hypothetical protein